jgi:hypothetical protein
MPCASLHPPRKNHQIADSWSPLPLHLGRRESGRLESSWQPRFGEWLCSFPMLKKNTNSAIIETVQFFEHYAKSLKSLASYKNVCYRIKQDVHPLNYLRVNVGVQQFDEFCDAFDVKEGDGMYLAPEERIMVW